MSEWVTDWSVIEWVKQWVIEGVSGVSSEQVGLWIVVSDLVIRVISRVSEWVCECLREWLFEWVR